MRLDEGLQNCQHTSFARCKFNEGAFLSGHQFERSNFAKVVEMIAQIRLQNKKMYFHDLDESEMKAKEEEIRRRRRRKKRRKRRRNSSRGNISRGRSSSCRRTTSVILGSIFPIYKVLISLSAGGATALSFTRFKILFATGSLTP